MPMSAQHIAVLKDEVIAALALNQDSLIVDATYGYGGHARAIMSHLGNGGRMLMIDRDPEAIAQANADWSGEQRAEVIHAAFSSLTNILEQRNLNGRVSGLLFDFGVSSAQLDSVDRGFSFCRDGPLDMRMNPAQGISAADWLEQVEAPELGDVLRKFGDERFAKRVAVKIKQRRRIETTGELAALITAAIPFREPGKHPATRCFQAIRIAVNQELQEIESVLPQSIEALVAGGRLVMISFHSLEDRLVKHFLRAQSKGDPFPPDMAVSSDMLRPVMQLIGKPVRPAARELANNRRARSAVMRVAEKLG